MDDSVRGGGRHRNHLDPFGVSTNYEHKGPFLEMSHKINVQVGQGGAGSFPLLGRGSQCSRPTLLARRAPQYPLRNVVVQIQPPNVTPPQCFYLGNAQVTLRQRRQYCFP